MPFYYFRKSFIITFIFWSFSLGMVPSYHLWLFKIVLLHTVDPMEQTQKKIIHISTVVFAQIFFLRLKYGWKQHFEKWLKKSQLPSLGSVKFMWFNILIYHSVCLPEHTVLLAIYFCYFILLYSLAILYWQNLSHSGIFYFITNSRNYWQISKIRKTTNCKLGN